VNAYVGTFVMRTGLGTQVVPVPFEAKALLFFGVGTLNTLMMDPSIVNSELVVLT